MSNMLFPSKEIELAAKKLRKIGLLWIKDWFWVVTVKKWGRWSFNYSLSRAIMRSVTVLFLRGVILNLHLHL